MPIEHFFQNIDGWFDFGDIYLEQVARAKDGAQFVEIGVYLGRSLAFLATEIANSGKNIKVFGVDKFDFPYDCQEQVIRHLDPIKTAVRLELLKGVSWRMAEWFDDGELDFIFVDAGHEYSDVVLDLRAWWPKLKPGGVIAGHDYTAQYPGVKQAVDEFFLAPNFDGTGKTISVQRSSWIVRT